jgi:tagatose-1,6-bisphosphate aldolase non-catalytic subunit AgaZ/GatZ
MFAKLNIGINIQSFYTQCKLKNLVWTHHDIMNVGPLLTNATCWAMRLINLLHY